MTSVAGKKILIIDDARDSARLLSMLLSKLGHQVLTASDGRSGVEIAKRERPQVILSDVLMAGMTGYAVARAVRAEPELAGCILIAVTGKSGDEAEQESLEAGFDAHLVKPIDWRKLEELMQSIRYLRELPPPGA